MSGTIRTHNEAVRHDIIAKLKVLTESMGTAFGMEAEFKLGPISHPVTVNTAAETARAIAVATKLVGLDNIDLDVTPQMTSEDFSFFLERVPGCYLFIGNGGSDNNSTGLHNSAYDFNDDIIPLGASFFVEMVYSYQDKSLE